MNEGSEGKKLSNDLSKIIKLQERKAMIQTQISSLITQHWVEMKKVILSTMKGHRVRELEYQQANKFPYE
jgi:hypothetical protein